MDSRFAIFAENHIPTLIISIMARDSFIFYRSFFDAIRGLGNKTIAEFLMAVADFALDGRMPQNISPVANALFLMAKPQIEANNRRYENGMKGGRPAADENSSRQKKSTRTVSAERRPNKNQDADTYATPDSEVSKPDENLNKTEPEPNVNVNVNDNTLSIGIDKETFTHKESTPIRMSPDNAGGSRPPGVRRLSAARDTLTKKVPDDSAPESRDFIGPMPYDPDSPQEPWGSLDDYIYEPQTPEQIRRGEPRLLSERYIKDLCRQKLLALGFKDGDPHLECCR